MANIFSVVALLIMFREALEASIIISVMLQMCDRLKLAPMKKVGTTSLSAVSGRLGERLIQQDITPALYQMQCGLGRSWGVASR